MANSENQTLNPQLFELAETALPQLLVLPRNDQEMSPYHKKIVKSCIQHCEEILFTKENFLKVWDQKNSTLPQLRLQQALLQLSSYITSVPASSRAQEVTHDIRRGLVGEIFSSANLDSFDLINQLQFLNEKRAAQNKLKNLAKIGAFLTAQKKDFEKKYLAFSQKNSENPNKFFVKKASESVKQLQKEIQKQDLTLKTLKKQNQAALQAFWISTSMASFIYRFPILQNQTKNNLRLRQMHHLWIEFRLQELLQNEIKTQRQFNQNLLHKVKHSSKNVEFLASKAHVQHEKNSSTLLQISAKYALDFKKSLAQATMDQYRKVCRELDERIAKERLNIERERQNQEKLQSQFLRLSKIAEDYLQLEEVNHESRLLNSSLLIGITKDVGATESSFNKLVS